MWYNKQYIPFPNICTSLFHVTAGINSCSLNPKIHYKFYILARTVNISFDSGKVENGDGLEKYFPFRISQDIRKKYSILLCRIMVAKYKRCEMQLPFSMQWNFWNILCLCNSLWTRIKGNWKSLKFCGEVWLQCMK